MNNKKRILFLLLALLMLANPILLTACEGFENRFIEKIEFVEGTYKAVYELYETVDYASMRVDVIYTDGTKSTLTATQANVNPALINTAIPGDYTLRASLTDPNNNFEPHVAQKTVTVLPDETKYVTGVAFSSGIQTVYNINATINFSSFELTATLADGDTTTLTSSQFSMDQSAVNTAQSGTYILTATYIDVSNGNRAHTAVVSITIVDPADQYVDEINVVEGTYVSQFLIGQEMSDSLFANLQLELTLNNGTKQTTSTGFTFDLTDVNAAVADTYEVKVTYIDEQNSNAVHETTFEIAIVESSAYVVSIDFLPSSITTVTIVGATLSFEIAQLVGTYNKGTPATTPIYRSSFELFAFEKDGEVRGDAVELSDITATAGKYILVAVHVNELEEELEAEITITVSEPGSTEKVPTSIEVIAVTYRDFYYTDEIDDDFEFSTVNLLIKEFYADQTSGILPYSSDKYEIVLPDFDGAKDYDVRVQLKSNTDVYINIPISVSEREDIDPEKVVDTIQVLNGSYQSVWTLPTEATFSDLMVRFNYTVASGGGFLIVDANFDDPDSLFDLKIKDSHGTIVDNVTVAGQYTYVVTHKASSKTTEFTVTYNPAPAVITSIEAVESTYVATYYLEDVISSFTFNTANLFIKEIYSDGSEIERRFSTSLYSISVPSITTATSYNITVTLVADSEIKCNIPISVTNRPTVASISILSGSYTTTYTLPNQAEFSNLRVVLTYTDNSTEIVVANIGDPDSLFTIELKDHSEPITVAGTYTYVVTYNNSNIETELTVAFTAAASVLQSIEVVAETYDDSYFIEDYPGEFTLDTTKMFIKEMYNTGEVIRPFSSGLYNITSIASPVEGGNTITVSLKSDSSFFDEITIEFKSKPVVNSIQVLSGSYQSVWTLPEQAEFPELLIRLNYSEGTPVTVDANFDDPDSLFDLKIKDSHGTIVDNVTVAGQYTYVVTHKASSKTTEFTVTYNPAPAVITSIEAVESTYVATYYLEDVISSFTFNTANLFIKEIYSDGSEIERRFSTSLYSISVPSITTATSYNITVTLVADSEIKCNIPISVTNKPVKVVDSIQVVGGTYTASYTLSANSSENAPTFGSLQMRIYYTDSSFVTVGANIGDPDSLFTIELKDHSGPITVAGTYTYVVTYNNSSIKTELTVTYNLPAPVLDRIEIVANSFVASYNYIDSTNYDSIDYTGLLVRLIYKDILGNETPQIVSANIGGGGSLFTADETNMASIATDFASSGTNSKTYAITVTHTSGKTTTFNVTYTLKEAVTSIAIKAGTYNSTYRVDDTINFNGIIVEATTNYGNKQTVAYGGTNGFSLTATEENIGSVELDAITAAEGTYSLTARFAGKVSAPITITVEQKIVAVSVEIVAGTYQTKYKVKDTVDTTSLSAIATLSNGDTRYLVYNKDTWIIPLTDAATSDQNVQFFKVSYTYGGVTVDSTPINVVVENIMLISAFEMPVTLTQFDSKSTAKDGDAAFKVTGDSYYVGTANAFKFIPNVTMMEKVEGGSEPTPVTNTDYISKVNIELTSSLSTLKVTTDDVAGKVFYGTNETNTQANCLVWHTTADTTQFYFTENAADQVFKITVQPQDENEMYWNWKNDPGYNFETYILTLANIKVVKNAWNAHTLDDLAKISNNSSWDKAYWEVKNINDGVILHNDFTLNVDFFNKWNDIGSGLEYGISQITYAGDNPNKINWKDDSLKDWTYLFKRYTPVGETFQLIGNYFTLDASQIPLITHENGDLNPVQEGSKITSNSYLFMFYNTTADLSSGNSTIETGETVIKNIDLKGNVGLSAPQGKHYVGGFQGIATQGMTVIDNVNIHGFHTSVSAQGGGNYTNKYNDDTGFWEYYHTVYMKNSKGYNNFCQQFFVWDGMQVIVENSELTRTGGPLFGLEDVFHNTYPDSAYNYQHPRVVVKDSKAENWVIGTEAWFQIYGVATMVASLKPLNNLFTIFGKTMLNDAQGEPVNLLASALTTSQTGNATDAERLAAQGAQLEIVTDGTVEGDATVGYSISGGATEKVFDYDTYRYGYMGPANVLNAMGSVLGGSGFTLTNPLATHLAVAPTFGVGSTLFVLNSTYMPDIATNSGHPFFTSEATNPLVSGLQLLNFVAEYQLKGEEAKELLTGMDFKLLNGVEYYPNSSNANWIAVYASAVGYGPVGVAVEYMTIPQQQQN